MRTLVQFNVWGKLLACLFLFISFSSMSSAKASINYVTSTTSAPVQSSFTLRWTQPVSNNLAQNRFLIVGLSMRAVGGGLNQATVVSFNSQSLTLLARATDGVETSEIWYLANPLPDTTIINNIVVSFANNVDAIGASTVFTGVDQITPIRASATNSGNSANPTATVLSVPGDVVIDNLNWASNSGASTSSLTPGATQRYFSTTPLSTFGGSVLTLYGETVPGAAPSVTASYTIAPANFWNIVIASLQPALLTAADSSISGQVTTSDGAPLAGTTLSLSGTGSRRTITNSAGFYRFDHLETNGFYTVTPSLANYSFNPASRSFSLSSDKTDALFSADSSAATANPLDTDLFFVRQHYLDFLSREPDAGGLDYWSSQFDQCNGDAACILQTRIGVSAAYFMSQEFQQTGSFVYRLYKGGLGRPISYAEFSQDRQQVVGGANLNESKAAFTDAFVQRPEFMQKYQAATTAEAFADALLSNVWNASGADLGAERSIILAIYNSGRSINESRSLALRHVIEDRQFGDAEYNRAFVLMQYFGYLKRDADAGGYDFWLNVLDNREPNNYRGMVCSFITSEEYQKRFSSVTAWNNRQCGN